MGENRDCYDFREDKMTEQQFDKLAKVAGWTTSESFEKGHYLVGKNPSTLLSIKSLLAPSGLHIAHQVVRDVLGEDEEKWEKYLLRVSGSWDEDSYCIKELKTLHNATPKDIYLALLETVGLKGKVERILETENKVELKPAGKALQPKRIGKDVKKAFGGV